MKVSPTWPQKGCLDDINRQWTKKKMVKQTFNLTEVRHKM
jgi:hypothetical protein